MSFPPRFKNALDLEKQVDKLERKVEKLRASKDEWKQKAKQRGRKLRRLKTQVAQQTTHAVGQDADYEEPYYA